MGLPSGLLREVFAIESPTETRNSLGESVQSWSEVGRVYGSYEAVSYSEQQLRWVSRGDRLLYIAAVVEKGAREEYELTVEEQAT
jgi:hypothetical protein